MKVEGWLFVGCAAFFAVMDVIYWHFSKDPTGTTALALSVGLAFLTGFYLLFTGRRLPPRPEDRPETVHPELIENAFLVFKATIDKIQRM